MSIRNEFYDKIISLNVEIPYDKISMFFRFDGINVIDKSSKILFQMLTIHIKLKQMKLFQRDYKLFA